MVDHALASPLHIHVLTPSTHLAKALEQRLSRGKYLVSANYQLEDFTVWLQTHSDHLDCLILDADMISERFLQTLAEQAILVPTVFLVNDAGPGLKPEGTLVKTAGLDAIAEVYHAAAVAVPRNHLESIEIAIRQALQEFIALSPESCLLPSPNVADSLPVPDILSAQQERLTDKLKARLGYLGVYYKRNPDNFLRNMRQADREQYLNQLRAGYRKIVLGYFSKDPNLNQNIDNFVNQVFFADISVSHIVEIHMELMDDFSKQLKLEGRSEEILLDYRLTLIDVIAHLCEMYRRSIPREP